MSKHRICDSACDLIGNTPLVRLSRLDRGLPGQIYLKMEMLNPGSSMKDRSALRIITEATLD